MSLPLWCHKHLAQGTAWHDFADLVHPKAPMDFWRLEAQVSLQLYKEGCSTGSEAWAKAWAWDKWAQTFGNESQAHEARVYFKVADSLIPYVDFGDLHDELNKVRQKLPPQALPEYRA
jgi:hypothetical protein